MTLLTTQDIAVGWSLIAAVLILAGVGVIWLGRSAWAERRAERGIERSCRCNAANALAGCTHGLPLPTTPDLRLVQHTVDAAARIERIPAHRDPLDEAWASVPRDGA